ncbi:MAG: hypothetical protein M1816_000343 [Peltula sp. TS41687]|nr:MAG: hypothetical protein M1816_000343 [Peltula sp. TS41687]
MDQPAQKKRRGRPRKYPLPSEATTQESAPIAEATPQGSAPTADATTEIQTKGRRIKRAAKDALSTVIARTRPVRAAATKARTNIQDAFTNTFAKKQKRQPVTARSVYIPEADNDLGITEPIVTKAEQVEARQPSPAGLVNQPEPSKEDTSEESAGVSTVRGGPEPIIENNAPLEPGHSPVVLPTAEPEAGRDDTLENAAEAHVDVGAGEPVLPRNEHEGAEPAPDVLVNADMSAAREETYDQAAQVGPVIEETNPINAESDLLVPQHSSPDVTDNRQEAGREAVCEAADVVMTLGVEEPNFHKQQHVEDGQRGGYPISGGEMDKDIATSEEETRNRASSRKRMSAVPDALAAETGGFSDPLKFPPAYEGEEEPMEIDPAGKVDIPKLVGRKITSVDQFQPLLENFKGRSTPELYQICSHVSGVLKEWQDEWMVLERQLQGEAAKNPRTGTWEGDEAHKQAVLGGYKPKGPGRGGKKDEPWPLVAPTTPEPDWGRQTRQRTRVRGRPERLRAEPDALVEGTDEGGAPTTGRGRKRGAAEAVEPRAAKRRRAVQGEAPPQPEVGRGTPAPLLTTAAGRKRSASVMGPEEAETEGAPRGKRARMASAQPDTSDRVVSDVPAAATGAVVAPAPVVVAGTSDAPKRRGRPPKAKTGGPSTRGGKKK